MHFAILAARQELIASTIGLIGLAAALTSGTPAALADEPSPLTVESPAVATKSADPALVGQLPVDFNDAAQAITVDKLAGHIRFLADDLLEGRGPGTRGDALTQLYIATQLQTLGWQPAGEAGTYRQRVPLIGLTTQQPSTWTFRSDSDQLTLQQHDDFIAVAGKPEAKISISSADLVFAGFGITAPEYDWDDYADTDVRGKIVVVMNNDPADDPQLFDGRRRLYYGRWDYKYHNAAKHGAAGAIIIHTDESAGYPFSVVQTSWSSEESELRGDDSPRLDVKAWVTDEAVRKLFELAGEDLDALRTRANDRSFRPVPLGLKTGIDLTCTVTTNDSANVLAVWPGSDEDLQDEYVMVVAHHDHIGIAPSPDATGDRIYNGAIDNASGTAALLSIASAITRLDPAPRRSILLAAVAAEEQGLLGSKYFAAHPTVPLKKISALVNMDSMNFLGRTLDLQVVGYGKSSLDSLVAAAASRQGRSVVPDQHIDRGYYYRSDQFSLARVGVPGVYLHSGTAVRGRPDDWGRNLHQEWTDQNYHQPSDEYTEDWDMSGMVEDTQLLLDIVLQIAQADQMQAWNPGDEFAAVRRP